MSRSVKSVAQRSIQRSGQIRRSIQRSALRFSHSSRSIQRSAPSAQRSIQRSEPNGTYSEIFTSDCFSQKSKIDLSLPWFFELFKAKMVDKLAENSSFFDHIFPKLTKNRKIIIAELSAALSLALS